MPAGNDSEDGAFIGGCPWTPAEYEQAYYTRLEGQPELAGLNSPSLR